MDDSSVNMSTIDVSCKSALPARLPFMNFPPMNLLF